MLTYRSPRKKNLRPSDDPGPMLPAYEVRLRLKLYQKELAHLFGKSLSTIQRMERDETRLDINQVRKLLLR